MSKQKFSSKFYVVLVLLLSLTFSTKAFAALSLSSTTLNATGNPLTLSTTDTNSAISLEPNGSGGVVVKGTLGTIPAGINGSIDTLSVAGTVGINAVGFGPTLYGRRMGTSFAAPSAIVNGNSLLNIVGAGYKTTAFSSYPSTASIGIFATENWTDTTTGNRLVFATNLNGTTNGTEHVNVMDFGALKSGINGTGAFGTTAWLTEGIVNRTALAQTYTDRTSTGTVATAVGSSFAIPFFSAISATTYTDAANVYIAGGVTASTNVTVTNNYGLWNVGKTRLDGGITANSALNKGTVALVGGTAAVTVTTGAVCVVSETTTAANPVKGAVVGTTLTITGTGTDTIAYICL